jgi:Bacterial Ig-like domain (group 2)
MFTGMLTGRRLPLTLAFAGLLLLAFGAGCRGFFVKPTLSSIVVTPATPTIQTGSSGNTVQMSAVGTFNDGSTGNPPVSWSSSSTSVATISAGGLVTAVGTGSTTITAAATQNPSITGTQTVNVTVGCITAITLSNTSLNLTANTPTGSIVATADTCQGNFDITSVATWTSSNTAVATVSAGTVTAVGNGTVTVTASSGNVTSGAATVVVTGFQ